MTVSSTATVAGLREERVLAVKRGRGLEVGVEGVRDGVHRPADRLNSCCQSIWLWMHVVPLRLIVRTDRSPRGSEKTSGLEAAGSPTCVVARPDV